MIKVRELQRGWGMSEQEQTVSREGGDECLPSAFCILVVEKESLSSTSGDLSSSSELDNGDRSFRL